MIKAAVLGFGVVGSGVVDLIYQNAELIEKRVGEKIEIKYILDLRDFPESPYRNKLTKDFNVILNDPEIKIVCECMGGSHPAYEFSSSLLSAGKSVVTSNKETVAKFGDELLALARENGVFYLFEASVGGGMPVIRPLSKCLAANEVFEVCGILNGTTNYILTMMNKYSESFETSLASAQEKGYAERDPSDDINGIDTCRKICILADMVTGVYCSPESVAAQGIVGIRPEEVKAVEEWHGNIKLLGRCRREGDKYSVLVAPFVVAENRMIAGVDGVFNAVSFKCDAADEITVSGRGAGKMPTASAMVSDVMDAASGSAYRADWAKKNDGLYVSIDEVRDVFFLSFVKCSCDLLNNVKCEFSNVKVIGENENEIFVMSDEMTTREVKEHIASLEKLGIKSNGYMRVLQ